MAQLVKDAKEAHGAGYSCKDCKEAYLVRTALDCKNAGYGAIAACEAGFGCAECRSAGLIKSAKQACAAGWSAREAKRAGLIISAQEAKDAGWENVTDVDLF